MNNADWISWFFHGEWIANAPVAIVIGILMGLGAIFIGLAKKNLVNIFFGIALLIFEYISINKFRIDLQWFIKFNLQAVKIFYVVFISVLIVLIIVAVYMKKHK